MPRRHRRRPPSAITFDEACERIALLVRTETRRQVVEALTGGGTAAPGAALAGLRACMRAHEFPSGSGAISLRRTVDSLDGRTRRDGLHVLHGWDFTVHRRPAEIAPVLLLDYCVRTGVAGDRTQAAVGTLLEQYCVALLGLLLVRAWDEGDPNANLDRLDACLRALQEPGSSGHPIADGIGTLLMLAVAYYHPEEHAYDELLRKVWTLDEDHRMRMALPCAGVMASHLRWGWRFMYRQDIGAMRADNVVDYPWSLFALLTLMRAWSRLRGSETDASARDPIVEALLNGLAADPEVFTAKPPPFLAVYRREHEELRDALGRHRDDLLADFARVQPSARAFSPLGFACNFVSNASVAVTTLACADATRHPSLDVLFARRRADVAAKAELLARRLMEYSADPGRLGAGGAPLIVYDPYDGVHHYNAVVRALRAG